MTVGRNPELDALIAGLPSLDAGQLFALAGEHSADDPAREAAWEAVRQVVKAGHLERDLDGVRADVGTWATHLGSLTGQLIGTGMSDEPLSEARLAAAGAVLDAAVAMLLGDRLEERDRAALMGPWESVFEE